MHKSGEPGSGLHAQHSAFSNRPVRRQGGAGDVLGRGFRFPVQRGNHQAALPWGPSCPLLLLHLHRIGSRPCTCSVSQGWRTHVLCFKGLVSVRTHSFSKGGPSHVLCFKWLVSVRTCFVSKGGPSHVLCFTGLVGIRTRSVSKGGPSHVLSFKGLVSVRTCSVSKGGPSHVRSRTHV